MSLASGPEVLAGDRNLSDEMDSLHILPLHIIPLQTPALAQSRMIKNVQFESMIEVFRDDETGSGQVDPSSLGRMFDWPKGEKHPDGVLVAKLSLLQSFDVYSLRISLRNLGIKVENIDDLRLSDTKRRELDRYMRLFTRPLVNIIYAGGVDDGVHDIVDMLRAFRDPNNKTARRNLRRLSSQLKIILSQLPDFLTDYGDVFLSLAYFKDRFDDVSEKSKFLLKKLTNVRADSVLMSDPILIATLDEVEAELNDIMSSINGHLETFDTHTATLWENLTASSFRKVKLLIESNHAMLGGMLCGLQIKMDGFHNQFYGKEATTRKIADYIAQNIKPGIDRIRNIERTGRLANRV